uniref:Basic phospholipase A2 BP-I n=2 Tax=Protobothrops TaxID=103943 RepID=PA2B1_PROFL|nr:RecName: Full=Basic phospholipase A2 BP-I; Short=svPLA2; AltName: Full=Basic protein I; Short=BP1; Short=BPI; AltName: Full=Phosphatidylcholine 2-acylhydrolase; Flags: Precursor [Protobothrops flavoviridis]ALN37915.1 Lys49 phospholipase A2 isozyme BP-I [Protobothrops tokarensis]ALN37918.1 phospholipase A2 isozyme BP-I precursor [Protobothrops tokarensis]BAA01561.1 phospholipase A2 isozyme, basic protein I [Protobothrops flavoviridis]BAA02651.1 phospholipase A2 [Protobothrops flavoviridis]
MRTLWIMAVLLLGVDGSLVQLWKMIFQETGKEAAKNYGLYGCNCGVGRRGKPKDATDSCCYVHKCCYKKVTGCDPKMDSYSYSWKNKAIVCGEKNPPCLKQVCECDKAVAICLRENLGTYNKKYTIYPKPFCKKADTC